jgi:enamine deaminase RidA (YjgF/YER057c/UK114 family)
MTAEAHGKRQSIRPAGTERSYDLLHFSPAVRVGDIVWVSGQVGSDASGMPGDDMEAQARLAFGKLKTVLAEAGATMADVVELMTFHTDLRGEIADFVKVKDEFIPADFPAWSAVGVTQLARAEYLVEVRAIAVVGSGAA